MAQILEGVKVLDLSCVVAAPMSASLLSDFGADVIRIEKPAGDMRTSDYHKVLNRNKRCITMDFHKEEVLEQFYELVKWADVIVANFRPQTLKRFKVDYEDCVKHNPKIIYLSFSAFGRTGPYSHKPGFARVSEAFTGLPYITGWPDRPPSASGSWIADGIGGIYSAYMISLALLHRERTGEGQMIDLGLYEPLFRILEDMPIAYYATGNVRMRSGNMHATAVPNNYYETSDGEWLAMPLNFAMFPRFCDAMGRPELKVDERFATMPARKANKIFVDGTVADMVKTKTKAEMMALAEEYEFACGPINSIKDIFEDPHIWERGSLVKVTDEVTGKETVINGVCGVFSKTPGEFHHLCPPVGAHNDDIYKGMLGLSDEKLQSLKDAGAI